MMLVQLGIELQGNVASDPLPEPAFKQFFSAFNGWRFVLPTCYFHAMKKIRQIHFYLGVFFAPMIIFFALSGALQTFRLQESPKGSAYTPPSWIVRFADIHKDQRAAHEPGVRPSLPLKWLVVLMSVGLMSTSLLGIYMAFKYNRDKRMVYGLIALGLIIPLALLYL